MRTGNDSEAVAVRTAEDYRQAVAEAQQLDTAREGSRDYARLQALRGAMAEYEMRHQGPEHKKGRPDPALS